MFDSIQYKCFINLLKNPMQGEYINRKLWFSIITKHSALIEILTKRFVLLPYGKGVQISYNPLTRASSIIQLLGLGFASGLLLYFACSPRKWVITTT